MSCLQNREAFCERAKLLCKDEPSDKMARRNAEKITGHHKRNKDIDNLARQEINGQQGTY
jgi:hypothetical protein